MKEVILLGKGSLAIRIADWFVHSPEHSLRLVVPVVPEPQWTESFVAWSERAGVPYVPSGHYADIEGVREDGWRVDLAFSVFYDRILPEWFIAACDRILNIHNSPLPRYRGVSPINWALKNGEQSHGVTIHEITPGIDDGPVVAQVEYSIYPELDEVRDVYERGLAYGWTLFEQTMPILDRVSSRPQDESRATYYRAADNDQLGERRGFTREASSRPPTSTHALD
jgi:methionyl-tRNA formyltransferase